MSELQCWTGELLPDDLDEDWTAAPRDEAREAYGTVLRALVTHATERGDHDGTVRRCLRLLELDPVDEDAHLALVRALADARRTVRLVGATTSTRPGWASSV